MGIADLFKPAHRPSNPEKRLKAVRHLDDQTILAKLAETDPSPRVRLAAIRRVDDQDLLVRIALDGTEIDARLAAVEKIVSQEKLAEIIKARKNFQLMGACFARITDRETLQRIAYDTGYNMAARRMAIENFADESYLADFERSTDDRGALKTPEEIAAMIDKYGGVRLARALGKFRGSASAMKTLGEIMRHGGDAALVAVEYLAQGLAHAAADIRRTAAGQLKGLTETGLIIHLIRQMDNAALHDHILNVLREIDHPEARQMVEKSDG